MSGFWGMAVALIGLTAALLLWPLSRRNARVDSGMRSDLAIYGDQLAELERERATGRIGEEEARAAKVEIERRILALEERGHFGGSAPVRSNATIPVLLITGFLAPAVGAWLYLDLGSPERGDVPFAARQPAGDVASSPGGGEAGDMGARAEALAERLGRDGGSFEDWWLLGQSFVFLERFSDAAQAYGKALELAPDDPRVLGVYAETLVRAASGRVTPRAEMSFRRILELEPGDPRARYYVGLSAAQNERFDAALTRWQELYRDSPADAPWLSAVRQGLVDMASVLGLDPANVVPDPRPVEVARAEQLPRPARTDPPGGPSAEPVADIDGLRARLEASPKDYQGWLSLARAEAARGATDAARAAITRVRELFPGAPFVQQQIARVEGELGLAAATRGPSAEDVAAAQEMTPEEQKEMIRGMVAGLAARLEAEPDDLQGWLMLLRSYGVLGDREAAEDALVLAREHFAGSTEAISALDEQARVSGISR